MKFLNPLYDADGVNAGASKDGTAEPQTEPNTSSAAQTDAAAEKNIQAEAQKIADAMVAKKLKGMPSKEEVAEFHKWKEQQKTEAERQAEALAAAKQMQADSEAQMAKAEAMMLAIKAGISAAHVEEAVIIASARANDDLTIEDAIKTITENNPAWLEKTAAASGTNLPNAGGNPPINGAKQKTIPKIF